MIILDTDHFTALKYDEGERGKGLRARMAASRDQIFAISVITVEEQLRGWLAEIAARLDTSRQVGAYKRLADLVRFFSAWKILDFDETAAERFAVLRKSRLRAGTMDLKIAAIALSRKGLLLTANTKDFALVPELRMENWLE